MRHELDCCKAEPVSRFGCDPMVGHELGWAVLTAYSAALTMSSSTFLASPKTIMVLSM